MPSASHNQATAVHDPGAADHNKDSASAVGQQWPEPLSASICAAVGHRSLLSSSSNPPRHQTSEARPQPCSPPDPVGGCPDQWPPAIGATREASARRRPTVTRTVMYSKTYARRHRRQES
jgi:hypothetical protein